MEDYFEDHRIRMRSRLTMIMDHARKSRKTRLRAVRAEANRQTREALLNARIIPANVRAVLQNVADEHGVTLEEMTGGSLEKRFLRARVAGIFALYETFPDRPLVWYDRPFGFKSRGNAGYHLRAAGRIPPHKRRKVTQ